MKTQSRDTSPKAEQVLIELLRKTPAWRKLQLTDQMCAMARGLCMAAFAAGFPMILQNCFGDGWRTFGLGRNWQPRSMDWRLDFIPHH